MNALRSVLVMAALLLAASQAAAEDPAGPNSSVSTQSPADAQAPADAQTKADTAQTPADAQEAEAQAPEIVQRPVAVPGPGGGEIQVPLTTFVDMRYRDMVRQAYDVSCGAAALASIAKYFYGQDVTERKIIDQILKTADEETKAKIQKDGFSMLELKKEGERLGLTAGGFRIPEAASLAKLKVPAIALVNVNGYDHFVVIRSVENGKVYIADPAFGNRTRTLESFADEWRNVILVFLSKDIAGNPEFRTTSQVHGRADQIISLIDAIPPTLARLPGEF